MFDHGHWVIAWPRPLAHRGVGHETVVALPSRGVGKWWASHGQGQPQAPPSIGASTLEVKPQDGQSPVLS